MQTYVVGIFGFSKVGKNTFVQSFIEPRNHKKITDKFFEENYECSVNFKDEEMLLKIANMKFTESFTAYNDLILKRSDGLIFMFSVEEENSMPFISEKIIQYERVREKNICEQPCILVGNKVDLSTTRKVSYDTAKIFAESYNMEYIETNSKQGLLVPQVVFKLIQEMQLQNIKEPSKNCILL